jgi:ribonucleoside-triphosphate reductase (formate)
MASGRQENRNTRLTAISFAEIRKRDGRLVPFNQEKIEKAIAKAGLATGEFPPATARGLADRALERLDKFQAGSTPTVEQIQDCVEDALLASRFKKTAKAYILYRNQHSRIREISEQADLKLIDNYLERLDWKVRENSNMAYSLQGLNNYIASQVSEVYWLNKIYSPEIRSAHQNGDLHLHDLGMLSVYCVGWDLQELLRSGFCGVPGKAESRPARHFRSALGQVVNFFYTLQGEAAGAQAFSNFDTLLAPFIRYDQLGYAEVKQALQEFIFNLNVPTRVGFQSPFTNVTMDLLPPAVLADQPVIIGGECMETRYGDFRREMAVFNRAFLEVLASGDARGRVFTFPIPTYNITPDFDWDNAELNPLWEVTARYGIPYFANFVNSDMSPDDARSMCCRLRLDLRHLAKRGGGLFGANPLTGSIGVVTINMPRLGHRAGNEENFLHLLAEQMEIARASLETKRKVLERFTAMHLYPYTRFYLRDVHKRAGCFWFNHFSTIGLVGMNEACLNLLGQGIGTSEGKNFALKVMDFMRDKLRIFQEETGHLYNLEATPAEGTSYRLAKIDQKKYPHMRIFSGINREPFYTNSTQLPVDYNDDIIGVLQMQDELQARYTGGTVQHVYLGEAVPDPQAVKHFVRMVCGKFRLPYFTLTPSFSICPAHGYLNGELPSCPACGAETEIYSRVVGYLRPVNQWNAGKQAEFALRRRFHLESGA